MFKNYLKIATRNIIRYKTYSVINILGLAIGIASVLIIFLVVQGHLGFESHNTNADRIFRINKKYTMKGETSINESTPYPLKNAARETIPEIEESAHLIMQSVIIKSGENVIRESNICFASPSVFKIFSIDFIKGDPSEAINDINSVAISEEMGKKYFGEADPIGKTLLFHNREERIITAVFKNIPKFSEYRFNFIINMNAVAEKEDYGNWFDHWMETFVLVRENSDITIVEEKTDQLMKANLEKRSGARLQPLRNIHLYSVEGNPTIQKYIQIFISIAILIMIIAVINFMNLATAQATKRSREVGLRKISGAGKRTLICQFIGESLVYTFIAFFVAIIILELSLPIFEKIMGNEISLDVFNPIDILLIIGFVLILGVVSGSYPAFVLSSFSPVKVLKSNLNNIKKGFKLRTVIVIIQFTIAIFLIIGTGVIYSQLNFMKKKNLGFDKENIIYMRLNSDIRTKYDTFKEKCKQIPGVIDLTRSSSRPDAVWNIMRGLSWEGNPNEEGSAFAFVAADQDFVKTVKLEIVGGRDFSEELASDEDAIIVNESAVEMMGIEEPIGMKIGDDQNEIIGVVKDFNSLPLNYKIEPLLIVNIPEYYRYVLIRISGNNVKKITEDIKQIWLGIASDFPFSFRFLSDTFQFTYESEITAGILFKIFASLGIFITCLGLFGLVSFLTEQKKREIGIRKVVGSTSGAIVWLLSFKFIHRVIIANLIAFPLSWFFMNKWLESFVYRTSINLLIFVIAGLLSLFITFVTISLRILKAANTNPVKALKYE